MPAAAAAARAFSGERLAMARSSAFAARAKAGSKRSLIFATPRIPQRIFRSGPAMRRPPRCSFPVPLTPIGAWSRVEGHCTVRAGRQPQAPEQRRTEMCLLALFFRAVEDAPLVVGANREEMYARPGEPPRI